MNLAFAKKKCFQIPAHAYVFNFAPNPDWTKYYVSGPEIRQYIKSVTEKYNLDKFVHLNTRVVEASWIEGEGQWRVTLQKSDGEEFVVHADIWCETESQKGILIGRGGQMIKAIGSAARREMSLLAGTTVHLDLRVRVRKRWRKDESLVERLGIG